MTYLTATAKADHKDKQYYEHQIAGFFFNSRFLGAHSSHQLGSQCDISWTNSIASISQQMSRTLPEGTNSDALCYQLVDVVGCGLTIAVTPMLSVQMPDSTCRSAGSD